MCNKHYLRWWSATDSASRQPPDVSLTSRWEPVVDRLRRYIAEQPNGCWHWTGHVNAYGYGQTKISGRMRMAHRAMYEAARGAIPPQHDLDHRCHNNDPDCHAGTRCPHRRCVNPDHLEPVRRVVNNDRQQEHKTHCRHGHPLSGDNLLVDARGARQCRACSRRRSAEHRSRFGAP